MKFAEFLKNEIVLLDGATGTMLQNAGLKVGEMPETWNVSHADVLVGLHKAYYDAGSNVVSANTFGANCLNYDDETLEKVIKAAIDNVKKARDLSQGRQEKFVAADIGPTGKLLKPYGDTDFETAVGIFSKTVKIIAKYGADLIFIQTMNDSYETKACLLAVKENCDLPVIVCNAYGKNGRLMTGATPSAMVALSEGMGADAIGANCSFGPKDLEKVTEELLCRSSVPVVLMPNAGLPKTADGKAVYDIDKEEFASLMAEAVERGVRVVGGCCGTTPEYIRAVADRIKGKTAKPLTEKPFTAVSSYSHAVFFGDFPLVIGERINPTGKKKFKEALKSGDTTYALKEAIAQKENGAAILDVNVGIPDVDEKAVLTETVKNIQAVVDLPLQIDTSDVSAMESAMRVYNGKPLVNSVNGKTESMRAVFPLVKKYGGTVIALTLDEKGIPTTAKGRLEIAEKILCTAKEFGIKEKDIVFDPLCMTVGADDDAANVTLASLSLIKRSTGRFTSLGVSNVSFGLPDRENLNANFLTLALNSGLDAAIINPFSTPVMKSVYAYSALTGKDKNFSRYTEFESKIASEKPASSGLAVSGGERGLKVAIIKGLKEEAAAETERLLPTKEPLEIINGEIIPALDEVGVGYENKTVYLPGLLMSAEAAKSAFEVIKSRADKRATAKCEFVIATVKGDIHDIGKNIVKLLLENYGFNVIDLGKDVPPERIVETVVERHVPLCGLSALMTTTAPAMKETVALLKNAAPWCRIVVGGAVITEDYAKKIGADKYAKDAMETVRFADAVFGGEL